MTRYSTQQRLHIYKWRENHVEHYHELQRKYHSRRRALQRVWRELAPLGDLVCWDLVGNKSEKMNESRQAQ